MSAHASLSNRPTSLSVVDPAPKSASSFNRRTNFEFALRSAAPDDLGFVEPVDHFGERVFV